MNLLLLYQNETSRPFEDEIRRELARAEYNDVELIVLRDVASSDQTRQVHETVQDLIRQCDLAVAILSPDGRNASASGNLWFEIGLWYGLKGTTARDGRPSILRLRWPDPSGAIDVVAPSDLGNAWLDTVVDEHHAVVALSRFLRARELHGPAVDAEAEPRRVKLTIGGGKETWHDVRRTHCATVRGACRFRPPSTRLIAELLRERDVNGQMAEIVFALGRIARHCKLTTDEVRKGMVPPSQMLHLLARAIRALFELGEGMLNAETSRAAAVNSVACERGAVPEDENDELARLEASGGTVLALVKEWLECTIQHVADRHTRDHLRNAVTALPSFLRWGLGVIANEVNATWGSLESDGVRQGADGNPAFDHQLTQIDKRREQADGLARLITLGGRRYFELTSNALSTEFHAYDAHTQSLGEMLNRAAGALPHNRKVWMDIWDYPRSG